MSRAVHIVWLMILLSVIVILSIPLLIKGPE